MSVLNKNNISLLMNRQPPLVDKCIDQDSQLQPNGIDLTLQSISKFINAGTIAFSNTERVLSETMTLEFDTGNFIFLTHGAYLFTFNEIVSLPSNIMALAKPRSSLLRCGVTIENAVWDAGYSGRSQAMIVVFNKSGFKIQKNARIAQMIFLTLDAKTDGYSGIFQHENI